MATQLSATFAPAATTTATPLPAPQQRLRHGRRCYHALSLRPPRAASGDDGAGGEVEPAAPAAPAKTATATDDGGDDFEERVLRIKCTPFAAAGAVFVKYEKERISVWPGPPATKPPATGE
ncbi:hypothetical protein OsJ_21385 [Oryza sativa Japonica Group]|uniref:Uncharacterized protein n=1 Tax=Oryza sativa subsp. japonica TaxID=39947 RepID=A3BBV2_ORYSJ|nr:hypothetical protein OsJ_21385 [Oryza sativa Japonica Group]